jgi:hypothetical protein
MCVTNLATSLYQNSDVAAQPSLPWQMQRWVPEVAGSLAVLAGEELEVKANLVGDSL